ARRARRPTPCLGADVLGSGNVLAHPLSRWNDPPARSHQTESRLGRVVGLETKQALQTTGPTWPTGLTFTPGLTCTTWSTRAPAMRTPTSSRVCSRASAHVVSRSWRAAQAG